MIQTHSNRIFLCPARVHLCFRRADVLDRNRAMYRQVDIEIGLQTQGSGGDPSKADGRSGRLDRSPILLQEGGAFPARKQFPVSVLGLLHSCTERYGVVAPTGSLAMTGLHSLATFLSRSSPSASKPRPALLSAACSRTLLSLASISRVDDQASFIPFRLARASRTRSICLS